MAEFQTIPVKVDAHQLLHGSSQDLGGFISHKSDYTVDPLFTEVPLNGETGSAFVGLYIIPPDGNTNTSFAMIGDWIVLHKDGKVSVMDDKNFNEVYKEVPHFKRK